MPRTWNMRNHATALSSCRLSMMAHGPDADEPGLRGCGVSVTLLERSRTIGSVRCTEFSTVKSCSEFGIPRTEKVPDADLIGCVAVSRPARQHMASIDHPHTHNHRFGAKKAPRHSTKEEVAPSHGFTLPGSNRKKERENGEAIGRERRGLGL